MVTPIQPGSFPGQTQPAENRNSKIDRSLSEARRLLNEHKITGAKAMRITSMIDSAQQSAQSGKVVDAERIAREALSFTQETVEEETGSPSIGTAKSEDESGIGIQSGDEEAANDKPLGERETTSYQDGSSDEGISFQSAQPLTQAQAPFAVRQHELSHIRRDTADAILNGQKVMTSVRIFSRIDPQTGERHVEGGNARIVIFPDIENPNAIPNDSERGNNIDTKA